MIAAILALVAIVAGATCIAQIVMRPEDAEPRGGRALLLCIAATIGVLVLG